MKEMSSQHNDYQPRSPKRSSLGRGFSTGSGSHSLLIEKDTVQYLVNPSWSTTAALKDFRWLKVCDSHELLWSQRLYCVDVVG